MGPKPNTALTALSCLPAALLGGCRCVVATLSAPVMHEYSTAIARRELRLDADATRPSPMYSAVLVHMGILPWPLLVRTAAAVATDTVPDWVDSGLPADFASECSPGRLEWKRRMAEEWKYTEDDVRVRDAVHRSAS